MASPVIRHDLPHMVEESLTMLSLVHVNEINHDDSSHVPKTKLPCDLIRSLKIDIKSVRFLIRTCLASVAGIDIYHMQRLRMLDYDVCTALERDSLSKRALYLTGDVEVIENRHILAIELHDVFVLRRNQCHIILNLNERLYLIYVDIFKIRAENIPYDADRP